MIDIGFTGTRRGMTDHQMAGVEALLAKGGINLAHHGDCVGADADFHEICLNYGIRVIIHPPDNPKQRAFCEDAVMSQTPLPYLKRNRNIVLACDLLIATPAQAEAPQSQRGGGTWYTVRYAQSVDRRTLIIPPHAPNLERDLQQARMRGFKEGFGR